MSDEGAFWDSAIEHYHWDRLQEAYDLISGLGVGDGASHLRWYRVIEAEHVTRLKSKTHHVSDWLDIEWVTEENRGFEKLIPERVMKGCNGVASRLGWKHAAKTHVAILARETDAPWATNPYGYCVEKYNYAKICIPDYLIEDPIEFVQAVAHEYAHVVSLELSDGHAPRWLEEAVSVLAERRFDPDAEQSLRQEENWKTPTDLERMFGSQIDEDDDKASWEVWLAYQQCGMVGRYLVSLGDEKRLGDLLRAHVDERILSNLGRFLRGKDRVDAAMESVYSRSVPQVFEEAHTWLRSK